MKFRENKNMKISLVISTYNWPEALYLCLLSVTKQTMIPEEVIIADDGSLPDTKEVIDKMRINFPCPLKHVWHEDKGFRLSVIRNKAFAICKGDYIIEVDGDIIMHPHFIEDHASEAKRGYFLAGSRGKMTKRLSQTLLEKKEYNLSYFNWGIRRVLNTIRIPLLTSLFYNYKRNKKERGCNISFWKDDLYAVNGCDERIVGYGFEDIDLCLRLRRSGIQKRFLKFKAIEYHIYHKAVKTKKNMNANEVIFNENNRLKIIKCKKGIDQYLQ
jgi:glycosyltransferase involved in cell wall biosynthesis